MFLQVQKRAIHIIYSIDPCMGARTQLCAKYCFNTISLMKQFKLLSAAICTCMFHAYTIQ